MVSKDFFRRCQFLRGLSYAFIIRLGKRGVNKRCVRKQIRIFFGNFPAFFSAKEFFFFKLSAYQEKAKAAGLKFEIFTHVHESLVWL